MTIGIAIFVLQLVIGALLFEPTSAGRQIIAFCLAASGGFMVGLAAGRLGHWKQSIDPPRYVIGLWPYSWVRHPGYLGEIIAIFGVCVFFWNPFLFLLAGACCLLYYPVQVRLEETNLLIMHFGSYGGMMRRTKRFIPKVF
jgi:protein-S-isoprenylcysteine O-methyltransferase Ste14